MILSKLNVKLSKMKWWFSVYSKPKLFCSGPVHGVLVWEYTSKKGHMNENYAITMEGVWD